jgi:putative transposase
VHATLRALPGAGSLRDCPGWNALEAAIAAASRPAFRVCHFSVQHDHVHLIVEASDRDALVSGLRGFSVRAARALNAALDRRGRMWADRYHLRALRTPREVRAALVYVLHNWKKTAPGAERLDSCSSARWFDGWKPPVPVWAQPPEGERPPVRAPRTWLLATGWRRHGLIGVEEKPLPYPGALTAVERKSRSARRFAE